MRLRHILIGLVSVAVAVTSVTSLLGLGEGLGDSDDNASEDERPAVIAGFRLATPARTDPQADPKGGTPVSVVEGQELVVEAHVERVKDFLVWVYECGTCPAKTFSSKPGDDGSVRVAARLPEPNKIYVVTGVGFVEDRLILGWKGGYFDERPAIKSPESLRVMATGE